MLSGGRRLYNPNSYSTNVLSKPPTERNNVNTSLGNNHYHNERLSKQINEDRMGLELSTIGEKGARKRSFTIKEKMNKDGLVRGTRRGTHDGYETRGLGVGNAHSLPKLNSIKQNTINLKEFDKQLSLLKVELRKFEAQKLLKKNN